MDCPYLETGRKSRLCSAASSLMAPSIEDADTYCTTEEHYRCPMLLGHLLRGGKKGVAPQARVFSRQFENEK